MLQVLPPSCGIFPSGGSSGYFLPLSSRPEELKELTSILNNSSSPSVFLWPWATHSLRCAIFPRTSYMSFCWLSDSLLLDLQISKSHFLGFHPFPLPSCFLFCAPSHFKCLSYRLYDRYVSHGIGTISCTFFSSSPEPHSHVGISIHWVSTSLLFNHPNPALGNIVK